MERETAGIGRNVGQTIASFGNVETLSIATIALAIVVGLNT